MLNRNNNVFYNQDSFYKAFEKDLRKAKSEVIIESPFLTVRRVNSLLPLLTRLTRQNISVTINTKPYEEHDVVLKNQAVHAVRMLQNIGVDVLFTVGHHRKIAIIDRSIVWEGSLNILSQNDSCEFMRRTDSLKEATDLIKFLQLEPFLPKMR